MSTFSTHSVVQQSEVDDRTTNRIGAVRVAKVDETVRSQLVLWRSECSDARMSDERLSFPMRR